MANGPQVDGGKTRKGLFVTTLYTPPTGELAFSKNTLFREGQFTGRGVKRGRTMDTLAA
jgi:hypothetical protein